jgi:predicted acyl esterase
MVRRVVPLALACGLAIAAPALGASAPDRGTAFEPAPVSQPLYGTQTPDKAPDLQRHVLTGHDGITLYVETWLPAAKNGNTPPAQIPTVLIMTPYVTQGVERYPSRNLVNTIKWFTERGYAVAQGDVRGTGESGGCIEQTDPNQIDDTARIVEYLGRDAPWSNGNVGMYGISYDGETQVSTAGLGDPERTKYLKAIVPVETVGGQYEYSNMDGVPYVGQAMLSNGSYFLSSFTEPGGTTGPQQMAEKFTCVPEMMAGAADPTRDMTPFWQVREYRPGAQNIKAATLWVHGFDDYNVLPITIAGFFDRLPATTPKAGLFGQWEHNMPDKHAGVEPAWARKDFLPMVTAWYDRYLKGLDSGVETWPKVQLQDSTGQWRAEREFPTTGGPAGQLGLNQDGTLGASGGDAVQFTADGDPSGAVSGTNAVFQTAPLAAPLHLSGVPVLDLWVLQHHPAGQITARIEALGADGKVLQHEGSNQEAVAAYGMRSLRHLDPMPDGYFVQQQGKVAPIGAPFRVPLRFLPTDTVVPAGGRLRLTIAGGESNPRQTLPTGAGADITIITTCTAPSVLRFLMPNADSPLLNVRETDEPDSRALESTPATAGLQDGGGVATAANCGHGPFDPQGLVTGKLAGGYEGPQRP